MPSATGRSTASISTTPRIYDLVLNSDDQAPEALAEQILARAAERFGRAAVRTRSR